MKRTSRHMPFFHLLGRTSQMFFIALFCFLVACLLIRFITNDSLAVILLTETIPWFAKGALTIGCGFSIVSILEAIRP
ncbi:hypothetical protein IQ260_28440 [Leptolyngbya cf. ectocarpi LEGE 11479]|uniref:Uncharacterized protein n=1 Tax=Leptolyngbya cf. ectocarpi LEGE 11479 TaxID=1828722 RepID=A0A928ZZX1_LEPEC|nr:hypothetical protein [Leptolyngbya ectocarpi]MBE9070575.1 hypothetical protein [Leptolyngbya cf. ectocarpi LEGE 11479]